MSPYVDKFILGYSNTTFSGKKIELSFSPLEWEIDQFFDLIFLHYVDISDLHSPWGRDFGMRDRTIEALKLLGGTGNDLIFASDTDEIPLPDAIETVLKLGKNFTGPEHVDMDVIYYNFRWLHPTLKWEKGYFIWEKDLVKTSFSQERETNRTSLLQLKGVHITFFFPELSLYRVKLKSYAHTEYSHPPFTQPEEIFAKVTCGFGIDLNEKLIDLGEKYFYLIPKDTLFNFSFMKGPYFGDNYLLNVERLKKKQSFCPKVMEVYEQIMSTEKMV